MRIMIDTLKIFKLIDAIIRIKTMQQLAKIKFTYSKAQYNT